MNSPINQFHPLEHKTIMYKINSPYCQLLVFLWHTDYEDYMEQYSLIHLLTIPQWNQWQKNTIISGNQCKLPVCDELQDVTYLQYSINIKLCPIQALHTWSTCRSDRAGWSVNVRALPNQQTDGWTKYLPFLRHCPSRTGEGDWSHW